MRFLTYYIFLISIFSSLLSYSQSCPNGSIEVSGLLKSNSDKSFKFKTDKDIDIKTIFWDFGDGEVSTLISPTHKYASEGNYSITVNVNNCFTSELVVNGGFEKQFSPEEMSILRNPPTSTDRSYINTTLANIYGFQTQHNYCFGWGSDCGTNRAWINTFRVGTKFNNTTASSNLRGDHSLNVENNWPNRTLDRSYFDL